MRGAESFYRFTKEANAQARQLFEKAVALDPHYADAYAWLAWVYREELLFGWSTDPQNLERALAMAQHALALDDSLPAAHSRLSYVYGQKQQYDQAIAEGERAIALDPNDDDSYAVLADILKYERPEEAIRLMEQAMRLNPRSPWWYAFDLGSSYRVTGRYAEAIATQKEAISRNPSILYPHFELAINYLLQWVSQQSPSGQTLEPAVAEIQQALALNDSWYPIHIVLGLLYLNQQQYDQALAEMERAATLGPNDPNSYATLAVGLSCVGRTEDALKAIGQALRLKPLISDEYLLSHSGRVKALAFQATALASAPRSRKMGE